ncbi:GNAT family N-acetyltransferase [Clostridium algidicarnis]|uniref:GNAT family N-acetyltransferase n=1 Tax=Clostridium algidicarnis TaxID=37659 RepID=UPI001C0D84BD|nr:GNAT family N-acetyltransferase [Clostridium algidicarnis]MBU3193968.1 GNAT family N-acetyltransferase [Clostridium algidicarnis]
MDLHIEKYKTGDEYRILELFNEVFKKEMKLEYWRWRYNKSRKKYINLMWDDENLAGHYAVFPIKVKYNDRFIESGFSMTTMTSSNYKKLGIFKTLAKNLYLDSYNELEVIWGFPNNNSLHGFVKYLEWKKLFDINMLMIDIELAERELKNKNNLIHIIDKFTNDYNKLFLDVSNEYDFIVKRDIEYLNWRFIKNPVNKYYILEYREDNVLKGYSVYKIYNEENVLYSDIVDFLAINKYVFIELIKETLLYIKNHSAKFANIWITDLEYKKQLFDVGFKDKGLTTHFGILKNAEIETLKDCKKYYLTMSDSDIF